MKKILTASCALLFVLLLPSQLLADDAGIEDATLTIEDAQLFDVSGNDSMIEDVMTATDATAEADAGNGDLDATLSDLNESQDSAMIDDAGQADHFAVDADLGDSEVMDGAIPDSTTNDLGRIDVGQFDVPRSDADPGDSAPCVPGCINESTLYSCSPSGALVVLTCPEYSICQVDRCVMQDSPGTEASSCSGFKSSRMPSIFLSLSVFAAFLLRRRRIQA